MGTRLATLNIRHDIRHGGTNFAGSNGSGIEKEVSSYPQLLRSPHIMRYGGTCPAGTNAFAQISRTPRPLHPQIKRYNTFGRS